MAKGEEEVFGSRLSAFMSGHINSSKRCRMVEGSLSFPGGSFALAKSVNLWATRVGKPWQYVRVISEYLFYFSGR